MSHESGGGMRRRQFLRVLSGATVTWPFTARTQAESLRRIGYLAGTRAGDARGTILVQTLQKLGWMDGRDFQIDYRWSDGTPEQTRKYAVELVALKPDLLFAFGTATMPPLLAATRTVPIVFVQVAD